jgi:MFS family permease
LKTFEALQYREFRYLWLIQATTAMGLWMDQVARGWLIYQLTNSALQLGSIRVIQVLPFLFLSPLAGTLADRYDRKTQMIIGRSLTVFLYGLLAFLVITHLVEVWHVYATGFASSLVSVFQQPPQQAMVSESVPNHKIGNAIALNSMVFNVARTLGPALAGLLIALVDTGGSYAVQTGFYVIATVWTMALRPEKQPETEVKREPLSVGLVFRSSMEGWRFAATTQPVWIGLMITMISAVLILPFTTLFPVFARDILHVGSTGQGLLLTCMGIGALFSATLLASVGERFSRGVIMLTGVAGYGLAAAAFAASTRFDLSIVTMLIAGVFHVTSQALVQTVVVTYSPPEMRGRMMATFQQNHVATAVGGMLVGALASIWGAPWAIASMGLACAACMGVIAVAIPGSRSIR